MQNNNLHNNGNVEHHDIFSHDSDEDTSKCNKCDITKYRYLVTSINNLFYIAEIISKYLSILKYKIVQNSMIGIGSKNIKFKV